MWDFLFEPLVGMGEDKSWLITANFILSVLLLAWLLRFRRLYLRAEAERRDKAGLIENLSDGIYTSSLDGRMISANPALARLNGYDDAAELIASVGDIAGEWYVDPARRAEFRRRLDRDGHIVNFVSEIQRHKTRERIWISESARVVYDPVLGKPTHYEGSVRDITQDMKRFRLEERLDKLTRQVPGGFFQILVDDKGRMTADYFSAGLMPTLGRSGEFNPREAYGWVHEDDRAELAASQKAALADGTSWSQVFRIRTESGAIRWVQACASPEKTADGTIWHGHLQDTTERKARELAIADMAFYDTLTHLPNRRMLIDRLPQALAAAQRRKTFGALLFIDLDDFKGINDSYGHDAGDSFLCATAGILRGLVPRNDVVARFGGDEFVVLLEDVGADAATAGDHARSVGQKILSALRTGVRTGNVVHLSGASIGVVAFSGAESSPDDLIKFADLAMYDAKSAGKNMINVFDPALLDEQADRYRLVSELHDAIVWEQLRLHFQPVLDAHGRVTGAEGLLRWPHETRGLVGPDTFVALAERAGMLHDLTKLVLSTGVQALAQWQTDPRTAALRLSLNMSVSAFLHTEFASTLKRLIAIHGVDATRLTLELSEKIMDKDERVVSRRMEEVKALGVRLALDDFGSGRSSVENLKAYSFDELKIDGGHIAHIETQEIGRMLVKTLLAMARTLEIETVAEHVETESQLEFLVANGCTRFQGYLFAAPKPAEDFLALVRGGGAVHPAEKVVQLRA